MMRSASERAELIIDLILLTLLTALAFGLAFHPYFFGDELISYSLASVHGASLHSIFNELNKYKPRLFFNYIQAILAVANAPRFVHAMLVAACMVWINGLLFGVLRYLLNANRLVAWLAVAVVLTSRFGTMFYFDYLSGMIELLGAALFFTGALFVWLAWHSEKLNFRFALISTVVAILCVMTHERYAVGLLTIGSMIVLAELFAQHGKRRIGVIFWAISFGVFPLLLFMIFNAKLGTMPIATGTAGQAIGFGLDTLWSATTYCYNVFLGGNYGHAWLWGSLVLSDPMGKLLGVATVCCTLTLLVLIIWRKGFIWQNCRFGLACLLVALSLLAIASLTGTDRQEARFAFPAGICVVLLYAVVLKKQWCYGALCILLLTNCLYLFSGSYNNIYNIYSSRTANSLASALHAISPNGRNGVVYGNNDNAWTIGRGVTVDHDVRPGDTFSRLNLNSAIHIDPLLPNQKIDPEMYDFGLILTGYDSRRAAQYRLVSVNTVMISANLEDVSQLPIQLNLGNEEIWKKWQWNTHFDQMDNAVILRPEIVGLISQPVSALDGRFLVYEARAKDAEKVPMRLQVNWNAKKDNRFISAQIQVVYPTETWHSYSIYLVAPPGAEIGYVYANLHDDAHGEVELKSVELK